MKTSGREVMFYVKGCWKQNCMSVSFPSSSSVVKAACIFVVVAENKWDHIQMSDIFINLSGQ